MKILFVFAFTIFSISSFCQTAEEYIERGKSRSLLKENDRLESIADLSKAINILTGTTDNAKLLSLADAYYYRGITKYLSKDFRGSIIDFTKSIEIDPFANAYVNRGLAKTSLELFTDAISDYNKGLELDPNSYNAYLNRARAKMALKDYRGSILDHSKAIEIYPNIGDSYAERGVAKIFIGQKENGCIDLSKAGELGYTSAYDYIKLYCLN